MLFNSFSFFLFFPTVTMLYFVLPHRFRWQLLLAASCLFYMAFIPWYITILALTIVIDYFAGLWIAKPEISKKAKRNVLIVSIVSTCLVLCLFKYFNFITGNLEALAKLAGWNYSLNALNLILPIGLSFHTFQSLSYVIEVYRGNQAPERHFGIYALYVMFYPQLVAGPIERPQNLLHQFRVAHNFDYQRVVDGLKLMAWGLFKKVVIADRWAVVVNQVYGQPQNYEGLPLIAATVAFAFQIYCDFSGYSDMAIGAAQVMGFRLMDNFNRPYFSKSIAEFWKRWHISLSTWFRDYLYIPLGGSRTKSWRWQFNLFITFLVSGLWHGANWTYVIWGGINGFYMLMSIWTAGFRQRMCQCLCLTKVPAIHKYLRILMTFVLVCVAWVFFRATSVSDAVYILTHMCRGVYEQGRLTGGWRLLTMGLDGPELLVAIVATAGLILVHGIQRHGSIRHMLAERPAWQRWSLYYILTMAIILFGMPGKQEFIYFQF
jgi:D-alanyl-lipoteichoic acid acyltransferase DltB (MBOAT superfamily)